MDGSIYIGVSSSQQMTVNSETMFNADAIFSYNLDVHGYTNIFDNTKIECNEFSVYSDTSINGNTQIYGNTDIYGKTFIEGDTFNVKSSTNFGLC